jgi:hypothetical protein
LNTQPRQTPRVPPSTIRAFHQDTDVWSPPITKSVYRRHSRSSGIGLKSPVKSESVKLLDLEPEEIEYMPPTVDGMPESLIV